MIYFFAIYLLIIGQFLFVNYLLNVSASLISKILSKYNNDMFIYVRYYAYIEKLKCLERCNINSILSV